jgi:hypothetical protein
MVMHLMRTDLLRIGAQDNLFVRNQGFNAPVLIQVYESFPIVVKCNFKTRSNKSDGEVRQMFKILILRPLVDSIVLLLR